MWYVVCGVVWCGAVRCGAVWCGVVVWWCVWCVVWCEVWCEVWCGVRDVWSGVTCLGSRLLLLSSTFAALMSQCTSCMLCRCLMARATSSSVRYSACGGRRGGEVRVFGGHVLGGGMNYEV